MSGRWSVVSILGLVFACSGTTQPAGETIPDQVVETSLVDEAPCEETGKQVSEADINGDARPDGWRYTATTGVVTCQKTDLDYDGTPDYVLAYDPGGNKLWEKFDLGGGDEFDRLHKYATDGSYEVIVDRDFDGSFDVPATP